MAVNKSAVQSSTSNHKVAAAALDSGSICAETRNSDNPWWLVDLGGEYAIEQVVVTRRKGVRGEHLHMCPSNIKTHLEIYIPS